MFVADVSVLLSDLILATALDLITPTRLTKLSHKELIFCNRCSCS